MYTANAQLLEAFNKEHEYLKTKLDLGREILWLTKDECIQAGPDVEETLELVKGAMIAHGRNEYETPAKIGIHPYEDVFFHAMPAYVPGNLACGCKWIECYPRNPKDYGLPQTTGLQIMNDIVTGVPIAVMDCTWLTAMRTPAVTAGRRAGRRAASTRQNLRYVRLRRAGDRACPLRRKGAEGAGEDLHLR